MKPGKRKPNTMDTTGTVVAQTDPGDKNTEDEKMVGWYVNRKDYKKVKMVSIAEERHMKDLMQEALRDFVKKKVKEGIIDKKGNILYGAEEEE